MRTRLAECARELGSGRRREHNLHHTLNHVHKRAPGRRDRGPDRRNVVHIAAIRDLGNCLSSRAPDHSLRRGKKTQAREFVLANVVRDGVIAALLGLRLAVS